MYAIRSYYAFRDWCKAGSVLLLLLRLLVEEVGPPAVGAGLGDGPVVRRELALGVAAAAEERAAPAPLALDDVALVALSYNFV